jgi:hypothetical protein
MAEVVGFEPTRVSPACFQDKCTRPLCDTSNIHILARNIKIVKFSFLLDFTKYYDIMLN